ncbi:hypothetical protein [Qipengyuania sphaerica]|uniref:hypothetical protein n=1 Tax=Qipengyuania sphaerica TaxID=2867243 RepID=UPI001C8748BC|nr:hypothetical protein [Qipengyuania sphaerica]MBX7541603.1 hypothetical protein [Qipengyuania sphaerica]
MDRLGGDFGAFDGDGTPEDSYPDAAYDDGAHSNPPPSVVGQDERRMQVRAYNHWASQLGEENLPHIEDLEPEFLGDFGPYSVLLDFSTGSETPTLSFIGAELRDECRLHDLIEELSEIPQDSLLSKVAANYLKVVQAQAPVTFEAESVNAKGRSVAYRGILLPYSSDHDTIDFVYAVVNWKEVADAQTADALLSEIDAALEAQAAFGGEPVVEEEQAFETAEIIHFDPHAEAEPEVEHATDEAPEEADPWASDDNILELRGAEHSDHDAFDDLPAPNFGQEEEEETVTDSYTPEPYEPSYDPAFEETPSAPKAKRAVDALGNPIGGASQDEETQEPSQGGITTASDYGLPEWDEEEEPEDDVDELVNPLANIDLNSRLLSLVNSGTRGKKTVDLATLSDTPSEEEDGEEERQLFKPKAPSVDSVLSLQEYDEDEEDEEEAYAYDPAPAGNYEPEAEADYAEPVVEEAAAPSYYDYSPVDESPAEVSEDEFADQPAEEIETAEIEPVETDWSGEDYAASEEGPVEAEAVEAEVVETEYAHEPEAPVEAEVVDEDEPLELGEELILDETFEEEIVADADATEPATVEDSYDPAPVAEYEAEAAYKPVAEGYAAEADEEPVATEETVETEAEAQAEPETLHGLLAAVNELAEAARTTTDPDRRALYEAVGKAFDISIKAVLASDGKSGAQPDIAPRDLEDHFEEMKAAALRQHG